MSADRADLMSTIAQLAPVVILALVIELRFVETMMSENASRADASITILVVGSLSVAMLTSVIGLFTRKDWLVPVTFVAFLFGVASFAAVLVGEAIGVIVRSRRSGIGKE